ncbi:methyltransferase domain-containing protein [Alphaproteobacteria bacterium]|nr:methyltransferase domain-containing protein [Alphaproteobacteria bacterium]
MNCRVCKTNGIEKKITYKTPINHNYLKNKSADFEIHNFEIYFCNRCGFIQSPHYIKPKHELYENYITLSSWKNQPQAQLIIDRMNDFLGLERDSKIADVGANDGSFLDLLGKAGYNNTIGIEPTSDASKIAKGNSHNIIQDFLTTDLVGELQLKKQFDVVISRHVLEHILELNDFLTACRSMLTDDGILILELPDHGEAIKYNDYSFWEEHVNYFTENTLNTALKKNGLEIFASEKTLFTGAAQIHFIKKSASETIFPPNEEIKKSKTYLENFGQFKSRVHEYMTSIKSKKEIIGFGAGCRLAGLVNIFELQPYITCFVDDNSNKVGKYLPMSQLEIQPTNVLIGKDYHVVMGVNAEVEGKLAKKFKIKDYSSFLPPSANLPSFWMQ